MGRMFFRVVVEKVGYILVMVFRGIKDFSSGVRGVFMDENCLVKLEDFGYFSIFRNYRLGEDRVIFDSYLFRY